MRFGQTAVLLLFFLATTIAVAQDSETESKKDEKGLNAGTFSGLKLRSIGPALMSGRVADIAIDSTNPNTWYVGVGSGNVWKTSNSGTTWKPIFDNYGSYSIGCVSIDPSNSNTIWVGTGENVGGRHIGFGDGVYVSYDAGGSFKNMGLKESEHIGKILIDPRDSNTIFVAAQGPLWSAGGERGLYKSTDGGQTWKLVLSKGKWTGVTDVAMDPNDSKILYAATHQRHRTVWALMNTGPESGIHKSTDGGETWTELTSGLPGGDKGKISVQVSPQKSNVVYATIELPGRKGGFYRSENFGQSWTKMSDYVGGGTGPHYYQEIYCDPHRFDVIYHANVMLGRSEDGGKNFESIEGDSKHVDNHAVAFHPTDPNVQLVGCDGGLYKSYDNCKSYEFVANLPLTQFYKLDVDYDYPFYNVVGGTQDNNTQYGPTATGRVQGITNADWTITIGGDGHDNAIDPEDPNTIYCESQEGFLQRYDRKTGESLGIRPQPAKGEEDFRFNWDSPILISPHSHTRLYFGSNRLHRSDNRGDSWTTISPDLSRNKDRYKLPIMGRIWSIDAGYDLLAMSQYGNITSISESPLKEGLIYVGTDDGLIHVTEDGGQNWTKIERIYGVPEMAFVNDIKADLHDENTVYACLDDHKEGDYKPYLVVSHDKGKTWDSMNGDLPDRHLVWRIVQDHAKPELFFLATEYGIYFTLNSGKNWMKINGGPTIPFRDLAIQKRENDLVGASFGRGFYVLDDYSPLRDATEELFKDHEFHIFPIKPALWYIQADRLGGQKGFQGDSYYVADNPPFGATFTYFVRDEMKTKKQLRTEAEEKARKAGEDTPIPDWEAIRAEELEESPALYFEIYDANDKTVARVDGSTSKGIQRSTWNLRRDDTRGLAAPGTYSVQAFKKQNDEISPLGEKQPFEVKSIVEPTLPIQDRAEVLVFYEDVNVLRNAVTAANRSITKALEEIDEIKKALKESPNGTPDLMKDTRQLELSFKDAEQKLSGDETRSSRFIVTEPSIQQRLNGVMFGSFGSTYGPTTTHREQFAIASESYKEVAGEIRKLVGEDLPALRTKLDAAKIPWTTGRPIPDVD
jgi:photosystem II stability/assembly factor-like uncharacterized protein